jgi:hypothetical protein
VLVMIFLTIAGEGDAPRCVLRYAWMTSAATPAVSGADWLVPPNGWMSERPPRQYVQLAKRCTTVPSMVVVLLSQAAQSVSPGVEMSMVRPACVIPADESAEMLLSSHLPLPNRVASA